MLICYASVTANKDENMLSEIRNDLKALNKYQQNRTENAIAKIGKFFDRINRVKAHTSNSFVISW